MLPYGINFLKEELDVETTNEGVKVKTIYGIERIPDIMILMEMEAYHEGLNVDRLIAFCALASFVKIQNANRGYMQRVEKDDSAKNPNLKIYAKESSFFKKRPVNNPSDKYTIKKSGFRNLK